MGELTLADLHRLVEDAVPESLTLDYKEDASLTGKEGKRDFVTDVSALANTSGGVLVVGVPELRDDKGRKTGLPQEIAGIETTTPDEYVRAAESLLQSTVDPPLTGLEIQPVPTRNGKFAFVIAVPRSFRAPHAVQLGDGGRIMIKRRGNGGNYPVAMQELRGMFLESSEWDREILSFRQERIQALTDRKIHPSATVHGSAGVLLQVLPLGRLRTLHQVAARSNELRALLKPPMGPPGLPRIMLDGVLLRGSHSPDESESALLWLRNGGIEAFSTHFQQKTNSAIALRADWICDYVTEAVGKVVAYAESTWGVSPPWAVSLSILGLAGRPVAMAPEIGIIKSEPMVGHGVDVLIPPVVIERTDGWFPALRPLFDMLWQSAGIAETPDGLIQSIENKHRKLIVGEHA